MSDNTTAFPVPGVSNGVGFGVPAKNQGMDLRDYFAAAALPAIIAATVGKPIGGGGQSYFEIVSKTAYLHADEMLKARGK